MTNDTFYFTGLPLLRGHLPIGVVLPYAGPLADTDALSSAARAEVRTRLAAAGWLFCNGDALDCKDYALLYAVIGTAFGGDGNGHFNLPDLRGRFVRGVDGGSGRDPSLDKRQPAASGGNTGNQVGSVQADAYQGHEHDYSAPSTSIEVEPGEVPVFGPVDTVQATTSQLADQAGDGAPRADKETRPVNLYLNHIIRYR
ncbi:phage tail protein [Xanthomonas sp. D-109]|uniref:phage tail protein n=1 Tax=Xanthomonas sp. D-109 TaxID=2821274 RepID=UPI001ADA8654|nr:phage tail protein [Xanthomonas sp. D-109]MBO9880833.1 tail fiber protein [Xanthomonas sp. D-109]